jgi:hypothetical protein
MGTNAKIATNYEQVPVRYNSYSDEVEFKKNGEFRFFQIPIFQELKSHLLSKR